MGRQKTHEEFVEEVYKLVGDEYTIIGKYINAKTKILMRHNICGYEWYNNLCNFLSGTRCPECAKNNKRKTHEEFCKELKLIDPNIIILSKYINAKTKVKCQCIIDNNIWNTTPDNLLQGSGCPKCSNHYIRSHEAFVDEVKSINRNIEVLSKFINTNQKVKCKCLIDGYIWEVRSYSLLIGTCCPKCTGRIITNEDFINRMKIINNNIIFLSDYIKSDKKVKCKCIIDKNEWEATPDNLLRGYGCPKCNMSKGENEIIKILKNTNIFYTLQYKFEDCKNKFPLSFDFAIFKDKEKTKLKCLIEYDGELHYQVARYSKDTDKMENKLKSQQFNDNIKNKYCNDKNIKLIRIPYWEFKNIEKILKKELKINK